MQILSLSGTLNNGDFDRVDRALTNLLEHGQRRAVLDLALLSSATTMSLARLLVCAREFRRHGGELRLAGLFPRVSHWAELAGFDRKKDFVSDTTTALESLAQETTAKTSNPSKAKP